jgi:hypothetical protein
MEVGEAACIREEEQLFLISRGMRGGRFFISDGTDLDDGNQKNKK